jgi:hypothetical protein
LLSIPPKRSFLVASEGLFIVNLHRRRTKILPPELFRLNKQARLCCVLLTVHRSYLFF